MKRLIIFFVLAIAATCVEAQEKNMRFGRFGDVVIYRQNDHPSNTVLFVSGDGGRNPEFVDMAQSLSKLDAMVVGIDINHYLQMVRSSNDKCFYPASDFEELSQYVQKELGFPVYVPPVLVGTSSGATLVYAISAQAPPSTFKGTISLGFSPALPLKKEFCKGNGLEFDMNTNGIYFHPAKHLEAPWIVFQGMSDHVFTVRDIEAYVKQVYDGDLVLLPNEGHEFSDGKNWFPRLEDSFKRMVAEKDATPASINASTEGLPLIEIPASGQARDLFAVIVSGDGGWAGIDRQIAKALSRNGIAVVGLNSLKYFWKKRTPDDASRDLDRILNHYFDQWEKKGVVLVGYSRGADVLPFMTQRLSPQLKSKINLVSLLGLETSVEFEIHPGDFFNLSSKNALLIRPEVEKLKGIKILCFYGEDEKDSLCPALPADLVETQKMKGGHHFGGDYQFIADIIVKKSKL